jgi:hypothetical protein
MTDALFVVVPGGAGLVAVAALVVALMNGRRLSRMEVRYEGRMRKIEDALLQAPTRDDLGRLAHEVHSLALTVTRATERMGATQHSVDLVAGYLMTKGVEGIEKEGMGHAERRL